MREIRFRAWHKEAEQYCEGSTSNMFQWLQDGQPVILEQYTGLKDCEGKEIYEGDIVRSEHFIDLDGEQHYVRHTCEWSNKYSGWYFRNNAESFDGDGGLQAFVMMKFLNARKIKIIGNIHQNPELIK